MADTFRFELVSPERLLMSEDVEQVVVPGAEGDFGVLVNHAPVLSAMRPGTLDIIVKAGEERRIFVRGGFADVGPDSLTVLAQRAIDLDEVDRDQLAQEIKNLEEDVADAADDASRERAEGALERLKEIAAAV